MAKKEMTYAQAICNALDQEMARDKNIVQLGEDIGFIGGNFKCTVGLLEKYGTAFTVDTVYGCTLPWSKGGTPFNSD